MARALYIHWPFCARKCPYCDFNSHVRESVDHAAWQAALIADMRHEAPEAAYEPPPSDYCAAVAVAQREVAGVDPADPATWGATPRNAACPCGSGKKYKHCHGRV